MKYRILIFLLAMIYVLLGVEDFDAKKTIAVNEIVLQKSFSEVLPIEEEKVTYFETTDAQKKWVDSVYKSMSMEEKIGQLFMVAAYSNKDSAHVKSIDKLIEEHKIGGLIFFQGGPHRQAKLTNRFQSKSKLPLFIGIDAEWGLSMRLDSTYRYPWNMTLGAVQDMKLIEKLGAQMGEQSKRMGIHFNFAPVLDINTNPKNPIIGNRSFGEDKENVTERALALMKGLQSQGVFATGKHFPGHGDTDKDSHYTLPTISFNKDRIDDVELYPYKKLINKGLASVMVAHLNVPSLEKRSNYPSSISYNIVTNILQKELGFDGLIFTDALNMKGASSFKQPGDIDLEAFLAGNDILLFPENVPVAIRKIKEAIEKGTLTEKRLEFSVRKILEYKFKAGLHSYKPIPLLNLQSEINKTQYDALQFDLYQEAVTVLKNKGDILPVKDLDKQKIAYVKLGDDVNSTFVETLNQYAEVTEVSDSSLLGITEKLKDYSLVIIGYHKADGAWKNHDFKEKELVWLYEISRTNKVILDVFAKPYSLLPLSTTENMEAIVVSYQNNEIAHSVSAQLLFGAIDSKGKLPVSINEDFPVNHGLQLKKNNRLGFAVPENVGMNPLILSRIDLIAQDAIDKKMAP
ncbi:MAG: glycoside hydrolase family 3 N-terminal domain-containing protein, partial [Flavobacterium sp.]|nr:glycoside hydrolase family 3 N-terminal domain-containing protein [Flavobacterium sp.]